VGSVDDMEDCGKVGDYIDSSQVVLVFLSKGYFFSLCVSRSRSLSTSGIVASLLSGPLCVLTDPEAGGSRRVHSNCLRELDHSLDKRKPLFHVHEVDPSRGGAPLATLKADCVSRGRDADALFAYPIVQWERVTEFQLLSLRMIAEATVAAMPCYSANSSPVRVYCSYARLELVLILQAAHCF
jgi:hypothetical protein